MMAPYSQEQWLAIIDRAKQDLPSDRISYKAPNFGTVEFAKYIDHTLLKLDATEEQIDRLCDEARNYDFKSVCVRLNWVNRAAKKLSGTSVVVACVVGFHEGTYSTTEKVREARDAVKAGASELDMVLNYELLKNKDYLAVHADIAAVRDVAPSPIILKVILETSQLSPYDIIAACTIAQVVKADFVKTSTGFNGTGASVENVNLMRSVIQDGMKVKASGGVKTVKDCILMMEAGADRIGTSSGVSIIKEAHGFLKDGETRIENRRSSLGESLHKEY